MVHLSQIIQDIKLTGEYQGTVFLSFSQLLGLNDTLTANFTKDISPHDDGHGSKQYAVNYTIPDGNRTYRLSTYKYSYNQLVFMPNAFRSAGTTQGTEGIGRAGSKQNQSFENISYC